jgi:hypothetical protein
MIVIQYINEEFTEFVFFLVNIMMQQRRKKVHMRGNNLLRSFVVGVQEWVSACLPTTYFQVRCLVLLKNDVGTARFSAAFQLVTASLKIDKCFMSVISESHTCTFVNAFSWNRSRPW